MSPILHDIITVILVLAGLAVLLGFTTADQSVGWVLLGTAGVTVGTSLGARKIQANATKELQMPSITPPGREPPKP